MDGEAGHERREKKSRQKEAKVGDERLISPHSLQPPQAAWWRREGPPVLRKAFCRAVEDGSEYGGCPNGYWDGVSGEWAAGFQCIKPSEGIRNCRL